MKATVTIMARNDTGLKQSNGGPESEKERQVGRCGGEQQEVSSAAGN